MKKLLRKLARKFFQKQIIIYTHKYFIGLEMIVQMKERNDGKEMNYIRHKIVQEFVERMLKDGLIEFKDEEDIRNGGRVITSRIRLI